MHSRIVEQMAKLKKAEKKSGQKWKVAENILLKALKMAFEKIEFVRR